MLEGTSQAEVNEVKTALLLFPKLYFLLMTKYFALFSTLQERTFNDAFSELFISTGGCAPKRPPPIWKTATLTTLSIFVSYLPQ